MRLLLFDVEFAALEPVQTNQRRIVIVILPDPNFLAMRGERCSTEGLSVGDTAPVRLAVRLVLHAKNVVAHD